MHSPTCADCLQNTGITKEIRSSKKVEAHCGIMRDFFTKLCAIRLHLIYSIPEVNTQKKYWAKYCKKNFRVKFSSGIYFGTHHVSDVTYRHLAGKVLLSKVQNPLYWQRKALKNFLCGIFAKMIK
jgi:hypothetical protein